MSAGWTSMDTSKTSAVLVSVRSPSSSSGTGTSWGMTTSPSLSMVDGTASAGAAFGMASELAACVRSGSIGGSVSSITASFGFCSSSVGAIDGSYSNSSGCSSSILTLLEAGISPIFSNDTSSGKTPSCLAPSGGIPIDRLRQYSGLL